MLHRLLTLVPAGALALVAIGCENKCDELVTTLTDCVSGEVGADETEETEEPAGDAECNTEDSVCATCVLEAKLDLCVQYGEALEACRAAGECESAE
jgi:hypothetical protein